jgi:hypothetical protein
MEITWRDVFWREHIFRWVLIVLSVALAQFGEEYIGGPINYSMLYGIAIIFGALNILYIFRPDQCTYQGKYRYPIAFLDLVYICLIIQATGGVLSNFYLVLGVLPLIAGAYFGMWGAPSSFSINPIQPTSPPCWPSITATSSSSPCWTPTSPGSPSTTVRS